MNELKVLFTAVGSIGTRHLMNLAQICNERGIELTTDVIRRSNRILPAELSQHIRNQYRSLDEVKDYYDVTFVTEATASHFKSMLYMRSQTKHMFVEKPIFDTTDYSLAAVMPSKESVYYVAAPIRFTKYYQQLKQIVSSKKVFAARIIFSSYMPNWQKGRDYRESFRTKRALGGGVDIDSLHEIDYITALFGMPRAMSRHAGHYSDLEMDACDIADYIFEYDDKLVQLQIDYFGRVNNRRVEFFCDDDVVTCDFNTKIVTFQRFGKTASFSPENNFYYDEMSYFIDLLEDAFKGEYRLKNINPVDRAFQTLGLAKGKVKEN
ncbi:dehydrogenase [Eggerthella sp. YY7918]|uniref:Gfo/Idh/MocA family protein n=1 Tax=Eggerthella sp. (strain YY7918) TaxID=502558 RepID=UPI000217135A|nr:dehydrogenase [Eggerthella sp. YY7918]BAK44794.1 predicted dehydrogenase [Eggerthella sp. YY7918]